jgi:hypothetical protein
MTTISKSRSWRVMTQGLTYSAAGGWNAPSIRTYDCSSASLGTRNPKWRSQIKKKQDATTPFTASYTKFNPKSDFYAMQESAFFKPFDTLPNVVTVATGDQMRIATIGNPESYSIVTANNKALKSFVQRANATQRSFQGGVFIGELRESLQMIRNPAKALRKRLDGYLSQAKKRGTAAARGKRGNIADKSSSKHRSVRSALADTYLENAFGWQPLLSDIDSGAKALARLKYHVYQPTESVSGLGHDDSFTESNGTYSASHGGDWGFRERTYYSISVRYSGAMKCAAPNIRVMEELGFTPRNFLPTVWELIPWSFVADYFTNIGDMIEGVTFNRASIVFCSKTERKVATKKPCSHWWNYNDVQDYLVNSSFRPSKPSAERKWVNRVKYSGNFIPDFEFEIPGMGSKWINLAALARNSQSVTKALRKL